MPVTPEPAPPAFVESSLAELSEEAWRLIDAAETVIADLDGCLAVDNRMLPGAPEFVARTGLRLVVASNNSTHSAAELAAILEAGGLSLAPQRLVLAGEVAVREIARQWPNARLMLLGSEAIRQAARAAGLRLVSAAPDVVLLTRATEARIQDLQEAIAALHQGARLVVANPDLTHPGERGIPRIETGAVFALLKAVLPNLDGQIVGKPEPAIFRAALAITGGAPHRAVMIGDNLATDVAGAHRLGMHAIQVRSPVRNECSEESGADRESSLN